MKRENWEAGRRQSKLPNEKVVRNWSFPRSVFYSFGRFGSSLLFFMGFPCLNFVQVYSNSLERSLEYSSKVSQVMTLIYVWDKTNVSSPESTLRWPFVVNLDYRVKFSQTTLNWLVLLVQTPPETWHRPTKLSTKNNTYLSIVLIHDFQMKKMIVCITFF